MAKDKPKKKESLIQRLKRQKKEKEKAMENLNKLMNQGYHGG